MHELRDFDGQMIPDHADFSSGDGAIIDRKLDRARGLGAEVNYGTAPDLEDLPDHHFSATQNSRKFKIDRTHCVTTHPREQGGEVFG